MKEKLLSGTAGQELPMKRKGRTDMKKKIFSKSLAGVLSFAMAAGCLTFAPMSVSADTAAVPSPVQVYDFSHSFEELKKLDAGLEVVENAAKPEIVPDDEMGNVLKLGKAVNTESQVYQEGTMYLEKDDSEYSTINITNPYKDSKDKLVEYGDHEEVKQKNWEGVMGPEWTTGVTISYWIKTSGKNSNVVGFRNNKYLVQSDDYAKYLCTVDFDKDYNSLTDEQRQSMGQDVVNCGVSWDSDYYFQYVNDDPTEQEYTPGLKGPVYVRQPSMDKTPDNVNKAFWMNKFYKVGYVQSKDGKSYEPSSENGTGRSGNYADYSKYPTFGDTEGSAEANGSKLRYGWAKGEMWLDSTSSFYFEGDNKMTVQENPAGSEYRQAQGMQNGNAFSVNSWYGQQATIEDAIDSGYYADSPVTVEPDKWHLVSCVIQNDWVEYYLDGAKIDMKGTYSSYGSIGIGGKVSDHEKPWKRFNKGAGSRYGYGNNKNIIYRGTNGNYVCEVIMDWLTDASTTATIGGGNTAGDGYNMFANTDEIELKNIVFHDEMLTEDQIKVLAENPKYYENWGFAQDGDADGDGDVNAQDALAILKHAAAIEKLDAAKAAAADVNGDGELSAEDALGILQYAAKIISSFDELKK